MTARGRMTMRAVLQRDLQTATDDDGSLAPPKWEDVDPELHCRLYSRLRPTRFIDGVKSATVSDLILMAPKGTDIQAGDRINGVTDRLGRVEHATPLKVQGPQRRAGGWGHIEVTVEDTST